MKNLILFTILIASGLVAFAQAPVMDSTWLPTQGNNYYDFNIAQPPHGRASDTGTNVVWDYSDSIALKPYPDDTILFVFPATHNISCTNNASNLAQGNAIFHHCYIKNESGLYETGSYQNTGNKYVGNLIINYSKPELLMKSNFRFRDMATDTSFFNYNFTINHYDSNNYTIRTKKWKYDGYGKLKYGGLTFDSVVRIHTFINNLDSLFNNGGYYKALLAFDKYEWYKYNTHIPILTIYTQYSTTLSGTDHSVEITNLGFYSMPIPHNSGMAVTQSSGYPNIGASFSKDGITVLGVSDFGVKFSLYDAEGRMLQTGSPQRVGNNKYIWKAANLSPGVYLLKVNGRDGKEGTVKIVKSTQE